MEQHGGHWVVPTAPLERHMQLNEYVPEGRTSLARAYFRARQSGWMSEEIADQILTNMGDNHMWYSLWPDTAYE
jgi:hypothetical protein